MNRLAFAFVAGLALGLWLTGWQPWGRGSVATAVSDMCPVAVHLRDSPPGAWGC